MKWVCFFFLGFLACCEMENFRQLLPEQPAVLQVIPRSFVVGGAKNSKIHINDLGPANAGHNYWEFALVKDPQKERQGEITEKMADGLKVKRLKKKPQWELSLSGLQDGGTYGVYLRRDLQSPFTLVHSFIYRSSWPQMVVHNLGPGLLPQVPINQRRFIFEFDAPVEVNLSEPLILQNGLTSEPIPTILSVHIEPSGMRLTANLSSPPEIFKEGERYQWSLSVVSKMTGESVPLEPIKFQGAGRRSALGSRSLAFGYGHDSAHVNWELNHAHDLELWVLPVGGPSTCPNLACGFYAQALGGRGNNQTLQPWISYVEASFLIPGTNYYRIARAEDDFGGVMIEGGQFTTRDEPRLLINELLPKSSPNPQKNAAAEQFIEVVNRGNKVISLHNLEISVKKGAGPVRRCRLNTHTNDRVAPGEAFLVVGSGFEASRYPIPATVLVIRQKQKNICGFYLGDDQLLIGLWRNKEEYFDQVQVPQFSPGSPKSWQREVPHGLEEALKFCYSDRVTPGLTNGPCG
jgi:hypothetical protein